MTEWRIEDEMREKRAAEYRNREQNNPHFKDLWARHQGDEQKNVNRYKEAVCFGCFKKDICTATIVDSCMKCMHKRGMEALLSVILNKLYGMCFFCGNYDFHILQINMRLCMTCNARVRRILKNYNVRGGVTGTDPFWLSMRKKMGKDLPILFGNIKTRR